MSVDLTRFCGRNRTKTTDMTLVHRRGGVACASDGKMLVWRREPGEDTTVPLLPAVWDWIDDADRAIASAEGAPLLVSVRDLVPCVVCKGSLTSRQLVTCPVCSGGGEHWCDACEAMHECGRCDGDGEAQGETIGLCIGCDGAGVIRDPLAVVKLFDRTWDAALVAKVLSVSASRAAAVPNLCSPDAAIPVLLLWSDQLRALLLGLKATDERFMSHAKPLTLEVRG